MRVKSWLAAGLGLLVGCGDGSQDIGLDAIPADATAVADNLAQVGDLQDSTTAAAVQDESDPVDAPLPADLAIDTAPAEVGDATDTAACGCPVAKVTAVPGQDQLDGTSSYSPCGKKIAKFKWSGTQPDGSALAFLPNDAAPVVELVGVKGSGELTICLEVWDDAGIPTCAPLCGSLVILAVPEPGLRVELLWDTPGDPDPTDTGPNAGADLDLHVTHPAAEKAKACQNPLEMCGTKKCYCQPDRDGDGSADPWFHKEFDAYWFNTNPVWGTAPGNAALVTVDDTDGWGPEEVIVQEPEADATYGIGVHVADDHGYGPSTATVRVYVAGKLTATFVRTLKQCDLWWVSRIHWPSGKLIDFSGVQAGQQGKVTPGYKPQFATALGGACM